jgi:hypothetical protein
MKICSKCKIEKNSFDFYGDKRVKSGLQAECKVCVKNRMKNSVANKKYRRVYVRTKKCKDSVKRSKAKYHKTEKYKNYRKKASLKYYKSEKGKQCLQRYIENNKEKIKKRVNSEQYKKRRKEYHQSAKFKKYCQSDAFKKTQKKYKESEKGIAFRKRYVKERKIKDIKFFLSLRLRKRLNMAIRNMAKKGSAVKDLGCSIKDLKIYLENKFDKKMTWENYGLYGWHIDHIKPLSSFDLTDREQFLQACHYTNLQPLWAIENLIKSNKILE